MTPDQELLFLDSFFGEEVWEFKPVTGEQRRADRAAEYVPVEGPVVLTRDAALEDASVTDVAVAKMLGLHLASGRIVPNISVSHSPGELGFYFADIWVISGNIAHERMILMRRAVGNGFSPLHYCQGVDAKVAHNKILNRLEVCWRRMS